MTFTHLLVLLLVGALAGLIGERLVSRGMPGGLIGAILAGLVGAYMIGKRRGYGTENLAPYDLSMAVIGTGLLWVGWFGFNGGSALTAGSRAVMAIAATHLAASAGPPLRPTLSMRGQAPPRPRATPRPFPPHAPPAPRFRRTLQQPRQRAERARAL